MGLQDGNSLLYLIVFILFFTRICTPSSSRLMSSPHDDEGACATANCGMGTCRETPTSLPGYACDCSAGWTMPRYGPIVWPSCIIPNCTINIKPCGGEPPMAPPPVLLPPLVNISSPCLFPGLCGDGVCVANGTSYQCQCPQGSSNVMGLPNFPCLQPCNFGSDCHNITLGPLPPATPPTPLLSLKSSASLGNGDLSPPSP